MRTTVTLDDDLAKLLEERAKAKQVSFREVLNSSIRFGLAAEAAAEVAPPAGHVVVRPFTGMSFRPGIDPNRLNQLNDELETEHFLEKMPRGEAVL